MPKIYLPHQNPIVLDLQARFPREKNIEFVQSMYNSPITTEKKLTSEYTDHGETETEISIDKFFNDLPAFPFRRCQLVLGSVDLDWSSHVCLQVHYTNDGQAFGNKRSVLFWKSSLDELPAVENIFRHIYGITPKENWESS